MNRTVERIVQPEQLILISIEAEFYALQNYREFFSILIFVFVLYIFFFQKSYFLPKKLKF